MYEHSANPVDVNLEPFEVQPAVALHHQIREDLLLHLRSGRWAPGFELPAEEALCRHYAVSRGTVRRAVADLVTEGYIERHRGKGTFVCRPKLESGVISSYSRFRVIGPPLDPGGTVLACRRISADQDLAVVMQLEPDTDVWSLERVRFTNGVPVSLQHSFIAAKLCPDLDHQPLSTHHLIDLLREKYNVMLGSAVEYVDPTVADGYAARHLAIKVRTPLFQIERTTYTMSGAIAEYRRALLRGDVYRYRIELR